jgi:transglutaminase-like putative cysteine protease
MTRFRLSLTRAPVDEPILARRTFDLLCLTMASVLVVHALHLPWWLTLTLAVVLAARWRQRRTGGRNAPLWIKLPLIGLLLAVVISYYGTLFGREPGSAFAVGLLVLKMLESEHRRDARVAVAFACFGLMSALLFDQGIVASFVVALGLVPAMATLRSLETVETDGVPWRRELLPVLITLLAAVPLAAFAFVFVPRLSSPLWGAPTADKSITGLSDRMAPGEMAEVLTDDTPAMRVTFDDTPPMNAIRYFRAYTMTNFDGESWSPDYETASRAPGALEGEPRFSYEVTLEPTRQRVLPVMDMPVNAPDDARLRPDRTALADRRIDEVYRYRASATTDYRLEATIDDRQRRRALQLPNGVGPQARELAASWAGRYGNDHLAIARAALAMFHDGGFRYTLAPAPLGRDRIDDFLFQTREGFCEHFSSTFTFLMRAAGVPARVVTGYQGGYWNKLGSYLLVRHADAHAWSEVWIEGRGWVRFDPTGAVRPERVSLGAAAAAAAGNGSEGGMFDMAWLRNARDRWDVVNQWWNHAVNGFDALRQQGLLQPFGIRRADVGDLAVILAAGCALLVAGALGWAMFQRREGDALDACMRRLERKLARAGVARRTGEGPRHFLARAARSLPDQRNALERLSQLYLRSRYAFDEPPPESLSEFRQRVKELKARRVVK